MSAPPSDTVQAVKCPDCGRIYPSGERHACDADSPDVLLTCNSCRQTYATGASHTCTTIAGQGTEDPAQSDLFGTIINERYEILSQLGRGGMGAVYKARHTLLESLVAVKVLLTPQDESVRKRFLQEAKLASQVRHPNTVYISDYGILPDQRPYLIMEYIQGETLAKLTEAGPLQLPRVLRLATQICRGLRAVHERGIVHRDLKPDNIFVIKDLGDRELVKIVDFGIATQAASVVPTASESGAIAAMQRSGTGASREGALTQAGALIGTPAYMAPEQILGLGLDQRADQYSLGCILYEMCTGALPFGGTTLAKLLYQHLHEPPKPMRERFPTLQLVDGLDELVGRLLAKEPAQRFASIEAVENELTRLLDRLTPGAAPLPARRQWPLVVGAVALTGALFAGGSYLARRADRRAVVVSEPPLEPGELQNLRAAALEVTQWFLAGASPELRLAAISALGQTHDEATLPLLLPLLTDSQPAVQAQAAEVIGQIGEPTASAALLPLLDAAGAARVEAAASVALDRLGEPRGRDKLLQMLQQRDPEAQFRAALALCERGDRDAPERLRTLMSTVRAPADLEQAALCCLALRGDDTARERLRDKLRGPLHNKLKMATAAALAQLGDVEARQFLQRLASTPGPEQILAGRWLAGPEEDALLKLFRQVLADPQAQGGARVVAAESIGASGDLRDVRRLAPHLRVLSDELSLASAGALLQLAANDPSLLSTQSLRFASAAAGANEWSLRQAAAAVLGDAGAGEEAVAQLGRLQSDPDARVRRSAARALGRRREYAALLALPKSLGDADAGVRSEALSALARLGQTLQRQGQSKLLQTVTPWLQGLLAGSPVEEAQARAVLLQLGASGEQKRLLTILAQAPPAVRLVLVENIGGDRELLARALADSELAVRLAAARALAGLGDKRAVPVLKEALSRGGAQALVAFGLLRRLGETEPPPADLERVLQDPDPAVRSQAVESVISLPLPQALALLRRAAQDADVAVRLSALEAAAKLSEGAAQPLPGTAILRLLAADRDPSVRARAAAVLARDTLATAAGSHLLRPTVASQKEASPKTSPPDLGAVGTPDAAPSDAASPSDALPAAAPAEGSLLLEGTVGTPVQIDKGSWATLGKQALTLAVGQHKVGYLDGELTVEVSGQKVAKAAVPPSPVERLSNTGQDLLKRQDFGKAQKQLERAGQLCSRDRRYNVLCASLKPVIAFALGRAYEGQDRPAEAMGEYEKVLTGPDTKAVASERAGAQSAVKRLEGQLGKVVVPRQGKDGCVEDRIWMPPGTHTVKVEGHATSVKVRAREVVKVGECK